METLPDTLMLMAFYKVYETYKEISVSHLGQWIQIDLLAVFIDYVGLFVITFPTGYFFKNL